MPDKGSAGKITISRWTGTDTILIEITTDDHRHVLNITMDGSNFAKALTGLGSTACSLVLFNKKDKNQEKLTNILGLIGNVDHSKGNGPNSAKLRGDLLNDIRTIIKGQKMATLKGLGNTPGTVFTDKLYRTKVGNSFIIRRKKDKILVAENMTKGEAGRLAKCWNNHEALLDSNKFAVRVIGHFIKLNPGLKEKWLKAQTEIQDVIDEAEGK